jgi:hypothetical protein
VGLVGFGIIAGEGVALVLVFVNCFDPDEQLVPLVVFAGGRGLATWKSPVQELNIGDQVRLHPAPVGQLVAAGASHLTGKELNSAVVDPVVVRSNDAVLAFVAQANQTCFSIAFHSNGLIRLSFRSHSYCSFLCYV